MTEIEKILKPFNVSEKAMNQLMLAIDKLIDEAVADAKDDDDAAYLEEEEEINYDSPYYISKDDDDDDY